MKLRDLYRAFKLDDALIVPVLVALALRCIPAELVEECRAREK